LKVFISWSGNRSRLSAEALREWLPEVIQSINPWLSSWDIEAGARWTDNVAKELDASDFGIICVTQDNQHAPWLLFEAGALAKSLGKSRVCPYLIDLEPSQLLPSPLTQFQAKKADEKSTWELIKTINDSEGNIVSERILKKAFHKSWMELEEKLKTIPLIESEKKIERSADDMMSEILELVRSMANSHQQETVNLPRQNLRQNNSSSSLDSKWKLFNDAVTERRPMIGGFLRPAKPRWIDVNTLLIEFVEGDDFFRTTLLERDNLKLVSDAAKEVFGDSIQIKVIGVD
jgi:hypothetical protein